MSDNRSTRQAAPYGVDSNPIAGMVAVYSETTEKGKPVIIGYLNKNQISQPGETRFFATDNNGVVLGSVYFKGDGSIIIQSTNPDGTAANTITIGSTDENNGQLIISTTNGKSILGLSGNNAYLYAEQFLFLNDSDSNNIVKYNQLATASTNLASAINSETLKIQAAIVALGGSYARAPITFNISAAKSTTIFCDG